MATGGEEPGGFDFDESKHMFQSVQAKPTFLLLPSQKKLPIFSGLAESKLEDWICDMKSAVEARPLSEQEKVEFIFQHLSGPAKDEVKFRGRDSVDKIFFILRDVFGVQGSSVQLQRAFFERRQKEAENLRDFSHCLLTLFERAKRKSPYLLENKEHLLNDQFAEGMSDILLRKHLKKCIRVDPEIDFFSLRAEAIEWAEESLLNSPPKVSLQASQVKTDTTLMMDMLQKQQKQIDELTKSVHELLSATSKRNTGGTRNRSNIPKCSFCYRGGHIEDKCYQLQLKKAEKIIAELKRKTSTPDTPQGN